MTSASVAIAQPTIPPTFVTLRLGNVIIAAPTLPEMDLALVEYLNRNSRIETPAPPTQQTKRKLTPAGRKRIALAAKKRHAAERALKAEQAKKPAKLQAKPKSMAATA
jgi:hypothetical protein